MVQNCLNLFHPIQILVSTAASASPAQTHAHARAHTHTHTQPFYGPLGLCQGLPGEPVPER